MSASTKHVARAVVLIPALGTLGTLALGLRPTWLDLALFGAFYGATMLGITAGYHRHFSHRAFTAKPAVRWALAIAGAMAVQGPVSWWVAHHRRHHGRSDKEGDPHTPIEDGRLTLRGLYHAHVGWMLAGPPAERRRYAPDLLADPVVRAVDRRYPLWIALSLVTPALLGLLLGGSVASAGSAFVWGGVVRIFATQHATWSINSIGHAFGWRVARSRDGSVNNPVLALLTLGEGWHANHHAAPSDVRAGRAWWQLDPTYLVISLLARFGAVTRMRPGDALAASRALVSTRHHPELVEPGHLGVER